MELNNQYINFSVIIITSFGYISLVFNFYMLDRLIKMKQSGKERGI